MKTTLNKIIIHKPCLPGWEKLLKHLGKIKADDEPLLISEIVKSNGFIDALWATRATEGYDKELRLFAVWCARQVQNLIEDERSIKALDTVERYAAGGASDQELAEARKAAYLAAYAIPENDLFEQRRRAAYAVACAAGDEAALAAYEAEEEAEEAAKDADDARAAQEAEFLRICAEIEKMEAAK